MNLTQIEQRAKKEEEKEKDIQFWLNEIKRVINCYPKGVDLRINPTFTQELITLCDSLEIPVYLVNTNWISCAKTYSLLYKREQNR